METQFLLTLGLVFSSLAGLESKTDNIKDACNNASLAFYKQSGLERDIDKSLKELNYKHIPKPFQYYLVNTWMMVQFINERKIMYTWEF